MIHQGSATKFITSLILIFVTSVLSTQAQSINYDDLYKDFQRLDPQQRFFRLFTFQSQNPHFANTYVQLGYASEQILKNLDPLRDFEIANYWVSNAVLYYSLFPHYLQSNEVRRTREYYTNIPIETGGRKLENDDVILYVQQRMLFCESFKDSVSLIYKALEKSKDHYNNCVRIFNQMNESYDNLNELLLQANPLFINSLNSLNAEFRQSIESFESYKSLIQAYPVAKYNQTYKLKNIQTYRLDGLTNSDFLKDTFELWNYGDWVNNVLNIYDFDIVSLRYEISSIQKMFSDNKRNLSLKEYVTVDDQFPSFDELFMFRLGKYDNNSLVRELFRYLNGRQNFLIMEKSPLNNPSDSSYANMNRKLRYYHRLAMQQVSTNTMLDGFRSAIDPEKVKRFWDFFEKEYGGIGGLLQFHEQEKLFLGQTMNQALQNFKNYLELQNTTRSLVGYATGTRGVNIPLYPITPDNPKINTYTYATQHILDIQGEPRFVSGYIRRQGQTPMAFTAKISSDRKIEWVREIGPQNRSAFPQGDVAKQIFEINNGCITLVSGKDANSNYVNTLVQLDSKGKDILRKKVDMEDVAVFYHFDVINQLNIMGFAKKDDKKMDVFNSFTICRADSVGNIQWKLPIELRGQLVDVVRIENGYLAFFNFLSHELTGTKVFAGNYDSHMAHLMVELSENGDIINHIPIKSNQSFRIDRVFSISSDEINLIGFSNDPDQWETKLKYAIISSKGKIIYKNFEE